ncbi:MAG TPA: alpha/beta hydrolase [Myxococcota bacterium]|nr:alpha/beta hydrolase [Myxococcota bacterium]
MSLMLALTGCMSLDGLVIPEYPRDAYDLSFDVIPERLVEEVTFTTADGATLTGVWAHQDPPQPPIIYQHGNGGPLDGDWYRVEHYWQWGRWDVFTYDYRGYGKSPGPATYDGVMEEDGAAAVRYVADAKGVETSDVPVLSLSLGAAVLTHTADEVPLRAIVLESMFASTELLLDRGSGLDLPTGWFFDETWDNVAAIRDVVSPVFIIHGQNDTYIDPEASTYLYQAAPDPKFIWRPLGVGHADVLEIDPDGYDARVMSFIDDPQGGPQAPE